MPSPGSKPFPWAILAWPLLWVTGLIEELLHRPQLCCPEDDDA